MNANGPAIKGGCVTRRKHRAESWYFSRKTITVQGGYGALFANQGTRFCEVYECRGTRFFEAANLSPVTKFVVFTGAAIAVQIISEPEICHGAGFYLRADAGVLVQEPLPICLGCRSKSKKCDKQLTFIVRVSC